MEILGLSASPSAGGAYALLLKEVYGLRRLPIIIGSFEAQSIALELEGIKPPRPLTHDLIKDIVEHLGASITEVIISELKDNTFYAKIKLEVSTLTHEIDSRPSDAIALSVRTGAPLFVSEAVMKLASFVPTSDEANEMQSQDIFEDEDEEIKPSRTTGSTEGKLAQLQNSLREAIEKEDYEKAAKIRDEINKLSGPKN